MLVDIMNSHSNSRRRFLLAASLATAASLLKGKPGTSAAEATEFLERPLDDLQRYLEIPVENRPLLADQTFASAALSRDEAIEAERLIVEGFLREEKRSREEEFRSGTLVDGELKMPFSYKTFGEKPAGGRSLYISMHGGGSAPKRVNDSQWENQKRLYTLDEGVYVAPRAPNDSWDMWHQAHIDRFFDRLIRDMVLFEDVDPDRVYLMGYSAGGDGVYQVAPRMADRFAAAAMMAGHPNETVPLGLRNLPFTLHMGANDAAFQRNSIAAQWKEELQKLRDTDPKGYLHFVKLHENKGHWMDRQDAEAISWMAAHTRIRYPERIVWKQDDVAEPRFYWLSVPLKDLPPRDLVVARKDGQTITFEQIGSPTATILLKDDLCDMDQPIEVKLGEKAITKERVPRTISAIDTTLRERGDPKGVFWGRLTVAFNN